MSHKYIVSHLEEQMGPFDETVLKAKWSRGELFPIDYVYDEVKEDWVLLSDLFDWAKQNTESNSPPPLSEMPIKKKLPPEPPKREFAPPTPAAIVTPVSFPVVATTPTPAAIATPVVKVGTPVVAQKPSRPAEKVTLKDGVGQLDINSLEPGVIELNLHESSSKQIRLQNPLKINVKAAEPHLMEWTVPVSQTVGQGAEIKIKALDAAGNLCSHFEGEFVIQVQSSHSHEVPVHLKSGETSVSLQHTKSEIWKISLRYTGERTLQMPDEKTVEWSPGQASRLILDGPQEYVAGHPLKVQVRAVDQYGNLAKTFQGEVVLEVKAS